MFKKDSSVNQYRIIDKIGQGGMGEVYLAHDSKLNRKVALKFLSEELGQSDKFRQRFTKEAQSAARLNHPNIVAVHEVGEFENRPYIAMTYVKGESLENVKKLRSFSFSEIIDLGIQIAEGLIAAHGNGITHRDLKPANIILDDKGKVHILDFGLALSNEVSDVESTLTKLTDIGTVMGTIPYMSPEQLRGQAVSNLMDIFALGVILYELTSGNRPFDGSSAAEITSSILRDRPKTISEIRPDTPNDLQRIIGRCLQKDPGRRIQTAKDVRNELEELRTGDSAKMLAAEILNERPSKVDTVTEGRFVLTADLVRKLENRSPRMIGGRMAYMVNNVRSDTLMISLHNHTLDYRIYASVTDKLPCTNITPTLFGWDWEANYRPTLSMSDHSIILSEFIKHFEMEFKPKRLILTGFASGAEPILQLLTSSEDFGTRVDGLLLLRCNIDLSSLFVSNIFSQMDIENEANILASLSKVSARMTSLHDWARHQTYLLSLIQRFEGKLEPVKRYSSDVVKRFKDDELGTFPHRYRSLVSKVPIVRFVFDRDEFAALDRMLQRHLEENVLGDNYSEKTITRVDMSMVQLGRPESFLEQALSFLKEFDQQLGLTNR